MVVVLNCQQVRQTALPTCDLNLWCTVAPEVVEDGSVFFSFPSPRILVLSTLNNLKAFFN